LKIDRIQFHGHSCICHAEKGTILMTTIKKRLLAIALSCAMVMTLLMGSAFAASEDLIAPHFENPTFGFELPKGGVAQVGDPIEKEKTGSAMFNIIYVTNGTGYPTYVNVRSANGTTRAGVAQRVYGATGDNPIYVSYLSGQGNVGAFYRPSAQTDALATLDANLGGSWRP